MTSLITRPRAAAVWVATVLLSCASSPPVAATGPAGGTTALRAAAARWKLPIPLQRLVVLSDGTRLLALGGLDASDRSTDGVLRIEPVAATVARDRERLPDPVHDAAGAFIGGRAMVFGGGRSGSVATVQAVHGSAPAAVVGTLPRPRSDLGAVTVGGTTYLVGGYDGKRALDTVLATEDGRRFRVFARLPRGLRYPAVTAAGTRIVVAGGEGRDGRLTDSILAVDTPGGAVRVLGHLPEPVGHAAAFRLRGTVFVLGGRTPGGTSDRIWSVDPGTGAVHAAGRLPYPVSDAGAAVASGRGWLVGGRGGDGKPLAGALALEFDSGTAGGVPAAPTAAGTEPSWLDPATGPGHLSPGSDPSVLPGPVLIADRGNNRLVVVDPQGRVRWEFPRPGDLAPGQSFLVPDDAFFTPDGRRIIVTQEDDQVITLVDIASRRIVWRYGEPGVHGDGPNRLWNPDDAIALPGDRVLVADIKNCRVLLIAPGAHRPERVYGASRRPAAGCPHDPPRIFGSPNGAFPMRNGHYLVTEIRGPWVDELDLRTGAVTATIRPPDVRYPSDTNESAPGRFLTVDYSRPGQIVSFDPAGRTLWRYRPAGDDALNRPSLALALPNGMVICNDDYNHRVIVVDPRSDRIVWQYGETGRAGREPGLLRIPDGLDLLPPDSLLVRHAATMGRP